MNEAYITSEIVRWARERMGLSQEALANALKVDARQLSAWEEGASFPPLGKAEQLANALRIPFGYLYLSRPPAEKLPIPDLRTLAERHRQPSPDFLDLLNDVLVKQDWYREFAIQHEESSPLPFVASFGVDDEVTTVAKDIVKTIGIDDLLRREAGTWDEYLRLLCRRAEDSAILVMRSGIVGGNVHRKLSVAEFRGFAVTDEYAPVVFLNGRDAKAAQIFTLAHELAHIWIGQSGISNPDPANLREVSKNQIESFCNSVAAQVLVPAREFENSWRGTSERELQKLAAHYRVSLMVVIRRAFDLDLIGRSEFFRLIAEEKERQEQRQARADEEERASGGNFHNTLPVRNSPRLTNAVLDSVQAGNISELNAARLLGVRTATLPTLIEGLRAKH